jgi:hypothetical protein
MQYSTWLIVTFWEFELFSNEFRLAHTSPFG